ncbi:MAG: hypothetical protein GXP58_06930 [Deltaproteobacteria bacterium]|nr:hypothetical protein [Deltaproteobacteria bacterium]
MMLLAYATGVTITEIVRQHSTNRPKLERCIDKALALGALTALDGLPRSAPPEITLEARIWLTSLVCRKPKEFGYSSELWTNKLLARHARTYCRGAGHPSLARIRRGTISKILHKSGVRPHKITYYLERRDPEMEGDSNLAYLRRSRIEPAKRERSASRVDSVL